MDDEKACPPIECPVTACGYNANMKLYDAARARKQIILDTTRSKTNSDAHRDMDGFDVNEELARLHRALKSVEALTPQELPEFYAFIAEGFANLDEHLLRLGALPKAWSRPQPQKQASVTVQLVLSDSHVTAWENVTHIPRIGEHLEYDGWRWEVTLLNWRDPKYVTLVLKRGVLL